MWDFSDDEWFFFILAIVITVIGGVKYYGQLISIVQMRPLKFRRPIIAIIPLAAVIPTCVVLPIWSDRQVAGHFDYILLFLVGAAACVLGSIGCMSILGISYRHDVLERNNLAALFATAGFALSVGIVYALSNIGTGPTIWTTLVPALIATLLLAFSFLIIEVTAGAVAETITVDRDLASALRLAGALLGCAVVLGGAAAGDWKSWNQMWFDFVILGWPAILLTVGVGIVHRLMQPTVARPKPGVFRCGAVPGIVFLLVGIATAMCI